MFWNKYPKINIQYGKLLDPIFVFYCKNSPELKSRGWNDWTPPNQNELNRRIEQYKIEWSKYEDKILFGIKKITKLSFKKNVVDVYIVSGISRALSNPIVMQSGFSKKEFIITLAHELLHHILVSNNVSRSIYNIFPEYHQESISVRRHIIIHAILKSLYLDILKNKEFFNIDLEKSSRHSTSEYKRSWEIVEEKGYKKILSEFLKIS